ncbi:MAG: 7-carboxy-7-deazaguanine synthase [Rhodospirillales bacterium]|nr:7-carboxy-7-deazaguanine synthase [Rhodospirillales bacterium]
MTYSVKEIFYTLQGEGMNAGRAAVFCRFAGCNLWSGREDDRAAAQCRFCDTDFVGTDGPGGGRFNTPGALARAARACWPEGRENPFIVCTGGEPLLQMDEALIVALHEQGFEVAVETNGTQPAPPGLDWVCVSPKAGSDLVLTRGDELKVVFPQPGLDPESLEFLTFSHFLIQPLHDCDVERNTRLSLDYCRDHPRWRLSLQTHKILEIP